MRVDAAGTCNRWCAAAPATAAAAVVAVTAAATVSLSTCPFPRITTICWGQALRENTAATPTGTTQAAAQTVIAADVVQVKVTRHGGIVVISIDRTT
jgi:hypothetical protein